MVSGSLGITAMKSHFSLLANDDNVHSLLEPPSPAYSSVTLRRASIVWLHCGQQNDFRHVCNYFHYLEAMEEKLSVESRAASRLHEFNLLSDLPPSSNFLTRHFPKLYPFSKINIKQIEEIKLEECVFNLEGFHQMKIQKGVTTKDIIKTSQMIRKYCKTHSKSLKTFLAEFQDFTKKTELSNSVNNVAMFIKKKYLRDELETWKNLPKHFSFLDITEDTYKESVSVSNTQSLSNNNNPTCTVDHSFNANKNANKIRILINESRRKELLNLIPNFSSMTLKDRNHSSHAKQNVVSSKFGNYHKEN